MKIARAILEVVARLAFGPRPPDGVDEAFWNRREQHLYGMTERVKKGMYKIS